ncbi:ATP-binding cassette domain-containing protein [Isoptericola dokdonensis]|uniref:Daunorubicin/doxorubicin resistance ATP-binding protein DrrA n=1 Tax=Isoptericola dokdonensis DS-3 TaxID=1300344 RepID=A0A161IKN1_9MICO|nr:ATP-binding cassette domain-containing protein [Isoptericola dokdonensis]ANC32764.1 Daunorubicin/doxorubicin resistance ATP-binding protein DrrA [Isoptericola dokdonensis DS-3]
MIHTEALTRTFATPDGPVHAVRGVDLDVAAGEAVALLGPNGAGKSTVLNMLTTLLAPTSGTARVAGLDVASQPGAIRRVIGVIGQHNGSFGGLRVAEELTTHARLYGIRRREAAERAKRLIDELDLVGLGRRDVAALSGGQRRRLDLAMGLVHDPDLVFLDEPSTGLDPQSRANLWDHIARRRREHGTTVLLTTHYLDEADAAADRVLIIDHGQIIADGTPDQLKAKVSGDLVAVDLGDPADVPVAAALAARLPGAHQVATAGTGLTFRIPDGDAVTPEVVRALDAADVRLVGTRVRRPSLDDVFLTLTGRSLRDDAA